MAWNESIFFLLMITFEDHPVLRNRWWSISCSTQNYRVRLTAGRSYQLVQAPGSNSYFLVTLIELNDQLWKMPPKVFEWTQTCSETNPYDMKDVWERWQQKQGLKAGLTVLVHLLWSSSNRNLTELDKKRCHRKIRGSKTTFLAVGKKQSSWA